jgi:hypothetical protein
MDKAEFHFKEYERALDLLNQSERSLDRLAFFRLIFLCGFQAMVIGGSGRS